MVSNYVLAVIGILMLTVGIAIYAGPDVGGGFLEYTPISTVTYVEEGTTTKTVELTSKIVNDITYDRVIEYDVFFISPGQKSTAVSLLTDISGSAYYNKLWNTNSVMDDLGEIGDKIDELGKLARLTPGGKAVSLIDRYDNYQYYGQAIVRDMTVPAINTGATSQDWYVVELLVVRGSTGLFSGNTRYQLVATTRTVSVIDDPFCTSGTINLPKQRDDQYCFAYGNSQNGRSWACDEVKESCVDPCSGCNPETGRCLASYAQSSADLEKLLTTKTSLCVSNQYVCETVSNCGNYIKQSYGNSNPDQGDVISNKNDFDKFAYGVHCEKTNPSDSLISEFNRLSSYGDLGTCEPKALSWRDCDNDEIFGSANGYRFIDGAGNFEVAKSWGVNAEGQCVLVECAGANDCPNNGQCIPKYLSDTQYKSSLIGYCAEPKVSSECTVSSDCASVCPSNQNPICTKIYSGGQYVGVCDCLDKPAPTLNCRTQTAYEDDAYCMWTRWNSLQSCTKYECSGDAATATCTAVAATCSKDSDCDVGDFKGYGVCSDGCCEYGTVPPPPVYVEICNNGFDDDSDGLIDCADSDCKGSPECGGTPGWDNYTFAALVSILAAMLVFSTLYSYRRKPKNKAAIAAIGALIAAIVVFALVLVMDLPIIDPFASITPNLGVCEDPNWWSAWWNNTWCELGNIAEIVSYLVSLGLAGLAAFFLYNSLRRIKEFMNKPLMLISFSLITFFIVFLIARALFFFAVIILIIFAIFKWVMSPLEMASRVAGGVGRIVKK